MEPERTLKWQLSELQKLVETTFVKTAKEVKGSYVTGDYVTWLLNRIFTPAHWSFTILQGPEVITLSDKTAYAQVVGRLEVTFIGGYQTHQDDIGIWPLVATGAKKGGTLNDTSPERYETVSKAARTDCLKNAAYNLGTCFGPLSDTVLVNYLQREEARNNLPPLDETAEKSEADLFGIAQEREGVTNATRRHEAESQAKRPKRGGRPSKWENFLADNELTEEKALKALGHASVIEWMKANPGKTETDAHAEILQVLDLS